MINENIEDKIEKLNKKIKIAEENSKGLPLLEEERKKIMEEFVPKLEEYATKKMFQIGSTVPLSMMIPRPPMAYIIIHNYFHDEELNLGFIIYHEIRNNPQNNTENHGVYGLIENIFRDEFQQIYEDENLFHENRGKDLIKEMFIPKFLRKLLSIKTDSSEKHRKIETRLTLKEDDALNYLLKMYDID
ncbi:MAG: hypothetical protein Q8N77_00655 [Nanoarchaeota archaeon]|nr:hypothetical protein [Nanoarchaeota archaeon]